MTDQVKVILDQATLHGSMVAKLRQEIAKARENFDLKVWTRYALIITSDFEGNGDPFVNIVGDFDGMGLTCGALGWCIGQGTLQPLVKKFVDTFGMDLVKTLMPNGGEELALICNTKDLRVAVQGISRWSSGGRVYEPYLQELKNLFGSGPMRDIQVEAACHIGEWAEQRARNWQLFFNGTSDIQLTFHQFAYFFDMRVNNGGLSGLWAPDALNYVATDEAERTPAAWATALNHILDWCKHVPSVWHGAKDLQKNGELWFYEAQKRDIENDSLFILGWLRALKARDVFEPIVMNRRGTMAYGLGNVNGDLKNFQESLGI